MEADERQIEQGEEARQDGATPQPSADVDAPAATPEPEDPPVAVDPTVISSTTQLPPDERPEVLDVPFEAPERNPMPTWALGVIVAAAAAIVVAVAIALLVPPTLALDHVLMDFDGTELEGLELTSSVYAYNEDYRLVGRQASGIEDDGTNRKVAHIESAYSNRSFSVVVGIDRTYTLVDRHWVPGDYRITRIDASPTAPVERDLALADIQKVLTKVAPYRGKRLSDVYADGEFEVISNELGTDSDGNAICTTTFRVHCIHDLSEYEGEVVATFEFFPGAASNDAGTWGLVSATASEEAWEPKLAPIEGTWIGVLDKSENTSLLINTGLCGAGRNKELVLTVKGYDEETGVLSLDVSFVAHNHEGIPEDADATEGDVVVTLTDQRVTLDENLEGSWVPAESGGEQGSFELAFINKGGVWELEVTSGIAGSDSVLALGSTEFFDTYVLVRG